MVALPRRRTALGVAAAGVAFLASWILRYNDPEGALGGLTDDHWFYVVQGWQLLYGELPDRDFNDPGAPLTYAVSAALQLVLGRSVWSEYAFCVLALSVGAAATCLIAARATGSILLGLLAAGLEIALRPRIYNWPKVIVYAVAIAAIWRWMASPTPRRTWLVAVVAAVSFLIRHDHGLYIGGAFALALLITPGLSWRERGRHAALVLAATVLLLAPYLGFLQANGGIVTHFEAGARYSARDYDRSPLEPPVPTFPPLFTGAGADEPEAAWWERDPFVALDEGYQEWFLYWLLLMIPAAAIGLAAHPGWRPSRWPVAHARVIVLAALALVLHYRLVRGNVAGRLADISVPVSILAVWVIAAAFRQRGALRVVAVALVTVVALATGAVIARSTGTLVRNSGVTDGFDAASRAGAIVTRVLERTWPLEMWTDETRGQIGLARYLAACTAPTDRVLMSAFAPPVYGLAQRGFAGGRLDLRGGFYDSPAEQRTTVERLQRQSVPIVIGPPSTGAASFRNEFPVVADYVYQRYESVGDLDLGGGLTMGLLVQRGLAATSVYEPLGLPCFR